MSNEEKVVALAKFIALKSLNINKAIEYGFMLDDLLDTIQKQQIEIEKKDERIENLEKFYSMYEINNKAQAVLIDRNKLKETVRSK